MANSAIAPHLVLKKAPDYITAYDKSLSEILLVGKAIIPKSNIPVSLTLLVHKEAIENLTTGTWAGYYFVTGQYYTESSNNMMQANLNTSRATDIGLYHNGEIIENATFEWYYR